MKLETSDNKCLNGMGLCRFSTRNLHPSVQIAVGRVGQIILGSYLHTNVHRLQSGRDIRRKRTKQVG